MKKFIKKISIYIFIILSLLIVVEALMPGNISGTHSSFIASIISGGNKDKEIVPISLKIKEDQDEMYVGETKTFEIEFVPINTSDTRVRISTNTAIVSIDKNNKVSALAEGDATLIVTSVRDESITDTITINIKPVMVEALELKTNLSEISVGTTAKLETKYQPSNTTYQDFTYQSSDSEVASVDEYGIVKGLKTGVCEIIAIDNKTNTKSNSVTILVNDNIVIPVEEMSIQELNTIYLNQHIEISPQFNDSASDKSFHIVPKDSDIIKVDNNFIIGNKIGVTDLEIISNSNSDIKKTLTVTVEEIKAKSIVVWEEQFTYGEPHKVNFTLIAVVKGLEVTNQEVWYHSSDEEVATIDENGYIYGKKQGNVTITITWKNDENIKGTGIIKFEASSNSAWEKFKGFVRKFIGHFSLFLLTGLFGYLTFRERMKIKKAVAVNTIYGTCLAVGSELLQLIPIDRACAFTDMLIDTMGYILGMLIIIIVIYLYKKIKNKKIRNQK